MDPSQKTSAKAVNSDVRPGFDKLAELERRYVRKDSPSPESSEAIRVESPWGKVSLRPQRIRTAWPIALLVLTSTGISGYLLGLKEAHREVSELKSAVVVMQDEIDQGRAKAASLDKRVKSLENADGAPLIVKGR